MWIAHEVDSERMSNEIRKIGQDIVREIARITERYPENVVIRIDQIMQLVYESFLSCDGCGRALSPEFVTKGKAEERLGTKSISGEKPISYYAIKQYKYNYIPRYCKYCAEGLR